MDELDIVREFRSDVPPADPTVLAGARAELVRQARGVTRPQAVPRGVTRPRMPRLRWALVGSSGLAAVVAGILVVGVLGGPTESDHAGGTPPSGVAPTTMQQPDAAWVLRNAALAAAKRPELVARPDQFLYVESFTAWTQGSLIQGTDGTVTEGKTRLLKQRRQSWLSVDGTHDGLVRKRPGEVSAGVEESTIYGCRDGKEGPVITDVPCTPRPAVRTDLPTDPGEMLTWLYRNSQGSNPRDVQAFITVGDLIRESHLSPASLSALFSAASRIPGATVDRDATDVAGRPGIAVKMPSARATATALVFDPATFEYLGERGKDQGYLVGTSVLRMAIVDRVGQLP